MREWMGESPSEMSQLKFESDSSGEWQRHY